MLYTNNSISTLVNKEMEEKDESNKVIMMAAVGYKYIFLVNKRRFGLVLM